MSKSPPAEAERVGPDPESGSFFALVAVGVVVPAEKPKGRSAMPSTVLITGAVAWHAAVTL